jgi:hypothetical protein
MAARTTAAAELDDIVLIFARAYPGAAEPLSTVDPPSSERKLSPCPA